ncbi:MAG: carboxypeptidase-like regulatory domain-containing protein [Muribaculaceae bacterium]|nr:carboxypeptidase-like regulatory domain-containing protein [Muribaculaceae bacterium]
MMTRNLLTAFVCMLCALGMAAQVKITGKVVDESGQPIEFATVRVLGTQVGVNTDTKGQYELTVAAQDTLVVEFTCIGYAAVKRQLIKPQGTITLNPKLYEKTHELTELQVTEYKKQTNTMQGIDMESIRLTPDASGGSVEAVLTTMAGVSSKNEMSSQYMVRGGSYDENSVYINGIEVYRPQLISNGQQEGLSIINPDMVKSVNFSTGGFNAEYGDKMSSVLDIAYREPQSFEGSLSASLQGGSLSLGQSSRKFSQLHGFRYKRNSSLLGSLESKGEYDPQYFDYQTHIVFKPSDKFKVSFLGNVSINNYRFTPVNRETSFGTSTNAKSFTVYFDGYEKDKFHTYFGALSLNYKLSRGTDLTLQASGYRTDELVTYDIHGEYWLDEAGTSGEQSVGGELGVGKYHEHERTRLKLNVYDISLKGNTGLNNHNLSYGLTMRRESIYDRSREWQWRDSAGYSLPHVPGQVNVVYSQSSSHDLNTTRFAAYVQDTYKLMTDRGLWSINGGVRVSYWDFNKETLVSPRFSIGFVPERNNRLSLRLAGGLYYQAPFYKEYRYERTDTLGNAYIDLNRNIKSQRSIHAIVGGDYTFRALNRPFKFTTEIYYKNLANLIPYEVDNLKVVYSGLNESKGYVAGIDLKLFGQFVEGTDSWISFSLMKTQETLNGVKVPRPTDQRYSFALFFTDYFPKLPRLKFSLKAIVSDGLPTTSPRMTRDQAYFRQPAYKRVDVGLSFQLVGGEHRPTTGFLRHFKSIWLGVDVFNLFDISNVSSYYWITDVNAIQYAVPNYLTRRQINARLQLNF